MLQEIQSRNNFERIYSTIPAIHSKIWLGFSVCFSISFSQIQINYVFGYYLQKGQKRICSYAWQNPGKSKDN